MSPERPGSAQSESAHQPPRMSVPGSPIALTPIHNAQSPISILLAVAQSQKGPDDDLTSLSWLHEGDVLKGMNINTSPLNSTTSTPVKGNVSFLPDQSPTSDFVDDSSISTPESSTYSAVNSPTPRNYNGNQGTSIQSVRNSTVPYDPLVHTQNKPPYSFSCLIFMAIEESKQKALPVKEIYAWILEHFPYFQNAPTGWKNSVRHNLSLNKCFRKVEKAPNLSKGSYWTVDPQYKPNLVQALSRSPPPFLHTSLDPSNYTVPSNSGRNSSNTEDKIGPKSSLKARYDLYPFVNKTLFGMDQEEVKVKSEQNGEEWKEESDAMYAARVMLSLKNSGATAKSDLQIITSPSQDHTYSAADSGDNEDEAFESDEDRTRKMMACRKIDFEGEDEAREGAMTLLNFARISHIKRSIMNNNKTTTYEPQSKMARYENGQESPTSEVTGKGSPFKPRLLKAKTKEGASPKRVFNNNQKEWLTHRRALNFDQSASR